ncbi:MAG: BMP family ABC transporter substrate-binding protein [Oscillospiraceae bacterium]|nr:BMP family ABC transporter substrate-binding protein [Oscillospiraceae bacterium]
MAKGKARLLPALAAWTAAAAVLASALAGCGGGPDAWRPGEPIDAIDLRIGIIYLDDAESGWSYAHELGIREAQKAHGLWNDQIIRVLNVSEEDDDRIEQAIMSAIGEGANVIIAPSWGFMDVCAMMADRYPNIVFAHASGYLRNESNFTNYFGRLYQARYLAGIVAGLKTRTGRIGFVAAQGLSNSEVTGGINAFAMGVESVNPTARVYVSVTHSWYNPAGERRAAQKLIDEGCDVIAQHCDTYEPQHAAGAAGVYGIGNNVDMGGQDPETVLTSVIWNWGAYYEHLIGSIIDGSFTTEPYLGGLADGLVDISPLNPGLAEPGMAEAVAKAKQGIIDGSLRIFYGEMRTGDGKSVGREGEAMSDGEILSGMDWYYHNVTVI